MDNSHSYGFPHQISASGLHMKCGTPAGNRGKPWFKKPRDKTDDSASLISGLRFNSALIIIPEISSGWNRFHAFHRPANPVQPACKPVTGEVCPEVYNKKHFFNAVYQLFKTTDCAIPASAEHPVGLLKIPFRNSMINDHLADKTGKGSGLRI